jgi:S1-C subfamily serine protease
MQEGQGRSGNQPEERPGTPDQPSGQAAAGDAGAGGAGQQPPAAARPDPPYPADQAGSQRPWFFSPGSVRGQGDPPGAADTEATDPGRWAPPPGHYGHPGGYGHGGYGQPGSYGQPGGHGAAGYGQAGYGQGGYGPGGYGQGNWAPPPGSYPPPGYGPPGSYGPRQPRRFGRVLIYVLVAVLAAGAGATAAGFALNGNSGNSAAPGTPGQIPSPASSVPGGQPNNNTSAINEQAVANKVEPGVVDITSRLHYTGQVFEGTGIVLDSTGLVLTNNHVVSGSTHLAGTVVTSGKQYTATVVGTDARDDVALIRLQGATGLHPVAVGDSGKVQLGTPVVAIGNAGGNGGPPTVTSGTITALNRTITASDAGSGTSETLHGMLQTNASIAEGDSGGPLSNAAGQVIAMDTAANSQSLGGAGTNQGFAIPINHALSVVRQIASGHGSGSIHIGLPAFMGVAVASVPAGSSGTPQAQLRKLQQSAARFGGGIDSSHACLQSNTGNPVPSQVAPVKSGALIAGVFCRAPAQSAGLTGGDVVTAINGRAVTTPSTLTTVLSSYHPGNKIMVSYTDLGGHKHTSALTLTSGPAK